MAASSLAATVLFTRGRGGGGSLCSFLKHRNLSYLEISALPRLFSPPLISSGICQWAQATKGNTTDVLLRVVGEKGPTEEVKHVVELAKRASLRREVLHTDFLTPPVLKDSMLVLDKFAHVKTVAQGGYPESVVVFQLDIQNY